MLFHIRHLRVKFFLSCLSSYVSIRMTSSYVIEQQGCLPLITNTKINITTCHSSCIIIILIGLLFLLPTVYTFTLTRVSIGTNLDYPCSLARDGATLFVLPLGISTHCYDDDILFIIQVNLRPMLIRPMRVMNSFTCQHKTIGQLIMH